MYKQNTIVQGQEDLIRELEAKAQESEAESRRKHDEYHKVMKEEHQDLKREIAGVKEQLAQLIHKPDVTGEATVSSGPRATFADVARSLSASPTTSVRSVPDLTKQRTVGDSHHCIIDTSRVSESNLSKAQIRSIRQAIEVEMRAKKGQETWRCVVVVREARNAGRVKIICRDKAKL